MLHLYLDSNRAPNSWKEDLFANRALIFLHFHTKSRNIIKSFVKGVNKIFTFVADLHCKAYIGDPA